MERARRQRTINYASLAPGTYRFLVRAVSTDGTQSAVPATVSFKILAPFWRRQCFVALASLIVGLPSSLSCVLATAIESFAREREPLPHAGRKPRPTRSSRLTKRATLSRQQCGGKNLGYKKRR